MAEHATNRQRATRTESGVSLSTVNSPADSHEVGPHVDMPIDEEPPAPEEEVVEEPEAEDDEDDPEFDSGNIEDDEEESVEIEDDEEESSEDIEEDEEEASEDIEEDEDDDPELTVLQQLMARLDEKTREALEGRDIDEIRERIENGTLNKIRGIGKGRAKRIATAMAAINRGE